MNDWSVYFVRTREGALYAGIATDVERRFDEHSSGIGAKYLRGKGPLELVWAQRVGERGDALRVEGKLKRMAKAAKEEIVASETSIETLLALLD